jgi:hypothetical protein
VKRQTLSGVALIAVHQAANGKQQPSQEHTVVLEMHVIQTAIQDAE